MLRNIDARGKAYRLTLGLVMAIVGAGFLALRGLGPLRDQDWDWPLYAGIGLLAIGAFSMFEGWAGWCAVRAMGFRTRV